MATASGELQLKPLPLLFAGLFVFGLLAVPSGQAQGGTIITEGFEDLANFDFPEGDNYTATTAGTGNFYASTARAHTGTKSVLVQDTATSFGASLNFAPSGFDLCDAESATFWINFETITLAYVAFTTAGARTDMDVGDYMGFSFQTINATNAAITARIGATNSVLTANYTVGSAWVDFTVDQINCSTAQARFVSQTIGAVVSVDAAGSIATLPALGFGDADATIQSTGKFYVDDIALELIPALDANFWCSTPSTANFDYDFQEDVDRVTSDPTIEIDPYYSFEGTSSDYGFLGKSLGGTNSTPATGSTHMRSYLRIEARADDADSNLRSSFTFIRSNGTPTVPVMDKGTGLTAGDDSGQFREHIEARWWEQGDNWDIAIFYVTQAGFPTRTQLGAAFVGDNPNTPTSYVLDVDTVAQTVEVRHFDGTVLLSRDLPSPFDNDEIYGAWLVGYHTDIGILNPALALDEDASTDNSTCLEDVTGLASFNGAPGRDPDSLDVPDNETEDGDEVNIFGVQTEPPEGFTADTFKFLLGIIFMAVIAGGFYFINQRPLMAGVGSGIGFMGAFAFGLFPLWAVLLAALIAAAVLVFRFKGSGG